jgi:hypothetical protein
MVSDEPARKRVNEVAGRLGDEFRDRLSFETIRELVDASFASYRGSRIVDFVPLLVYKSARDRLGTLSRNDSPPASAARTG